MERPTALETQDGIHNGQSVELPAGVMRTVLRADGNSATTPQISIAWSLEVPFLGTPEVWPGKLMSVQGEIDFGVSGTQHQVRFDWGRGGMITAPASAFHLKARAATSNNITPTARATASSFTRVGVDATRVTLTNRFQVDNGRPVVFFAPSFAHLINVYLADFAVLSGGQILVEALAIDGTKIFEFVPLNCRIVDAVELCNDVHFTRIIKTTPGAVTGALMHYLAL